MKSFLIFVCASFIVLASLYTAFLLPGSLHAHGTGVSLEKIIGEYKVDIGYDPPVLEALNPVYFDLALEKTGESRV